MLNLAIALVFLLFRGVAVSSESGDNKVLHILNILPFPDERPNAGWDRALELIPAAELAVEQINNRSDMLPDYRLELINVDSEACGVSLINKGLVNTYGNLLDPNALVVGVVGLFCSTVTSVIAPIVNFTVFDRVMVAGSTSPTHRNPKLYPKLFHTISSSTIFSNAMIRMMIEFNWQRVSIVHDSEGVIFSTSSAYFINEINSLPNFEVSQTVQILPSLLSGVIPQLTTTNTRIIFAIVTVPEAANLMCEAYKRNSVWPAYVYIFQERIISNFLETQTSCTQEEMIAAIEGIFLLNYRLETDPENRKLTSGLNYNKYYKEYLQRLDILEDLYNTTFDKSNNYANVAYDELWALALALNDSNWILQERGLMFEDYRRNQTQLSDIIQEQLVKLVFKGAAGVVNFTAAQETVSSTFIHQVRNGKVQAIGYYNPQLNDNITFMSTIDDLPSDQFEVVIRYFPMWLIVLSTLFSLVCYLITTFLLVLYYYHRKEAEIKASSPFLSVFLFIGCYLLYTAVLARNIWGGFPISGFTFLCNLEAWSTFNGLNLIYGTLFMRLLRVKHVFQTFGKTSKYWSNKFLFIGVLGFATIGNIFLVVWTASDTLHKESTETYIPEVEELPYFEVHCICSSEYKAVWVLLCYAYSLAVLGSTVFLAIQTRHIKHRNFKDTKKVNGYAFLSAFILVLGISVSLVLRFGVGSDVGEHIILSFIILLVGLLCQLLLVTPKIFPFIYKSRFSICKRK